jgi:hypothetical protein
MKTPLLCFVLASAAAVAFAADSPSLSGKWQVHVSIAGTEIDQACTITQKDSELTGSCASTELGTVEITGKVDGKKITWSYKSAYNGSPITVKYEGMMDSATKISGNVTVPEFGADGDFAATQSAISADAVVQAATAPATGASAVGSLSVGGKWQVHASIAGNEIDQACTITQKDSELTGSCASTEKGTVEITGKVDGKKITWSYKSAYNGSPITVKYEGMMDSATKISGNVTVPEFGADGDFAATQSN